jgi:hypothetical protein
VHALGANYQPLPGVSGRVDAELRDIVARAVSSSSHLALLFAATVVLLGTCLSFLIPANLSPVTPDAADATPETVEDLATFVPVEAGPSSSFPDRPLAPLQLELHRTRRKEIRDRNYL